GVLEEGVISDKAKPEEQWAQVRVPTLLLRAGQGMLTDDDQLLTEAATTTICQAIKGIQFVNFPSLNHYTILFGIESGPLQTIRAFIEEA
ncbi:MAG TPA: hypothetical protein VGN34_12135, partial [Ktedonobacteraceae bacterium]